MSAGLPLLLALCLGMSAAARADGDRVLIYAGYGTPGGVLVEGRVAESHAQPAPTAADGWLPNLRRNVRNFANDERKLESLSVRIGTRSWPLRSDAEGYFRLDADIALAPGWHAVEAATKNGTGTGRVLVVPPENRLGLISDLDDTVVVSEVPHKRRLLANTFLLNAAQRQAVPGMAALYARVAAANPAPATAPLFYLSASPRQLHTPIADFLAGNGFPPGVLITKRVSDDRTSDPLIDQFAYKTRKIEEILARLPSVRYVLVGDDGERDPEIYQAIRQRYPERVAAIWIRRVHPDPARARLAGQQDVAEVLATAQVDGFGQALPTVAPIAR